MQTVFNMVLGATVITMMSLGLSNCTRYYPEPPVYQGYLLEPLKKVPSEPESEGQRPTSSVQKTISLQQK